MQRKFIPVLMFFVTLLLVLASLGARITATPVFSFAAEEKAVYLTFDDGPSTVVTSRILDVLEEKRCKATFFIVGDRIGGREEVLRRIAKEGHTLGVHSQTHVYSEIYASEEALLKDVSACAKQIADVTGVVPRVYRFPGGGGKNRAKYCVPLRRAGYRIVDWNAVCGDEEIAGAGADELFRCAVRTSAGKETVVLLCHDSAPHRATAEALPRIIDYFRGRGYVFRAF